ncbi:DUF4870 family protein [Gallibacterium genomosp. 1]|uniref:DUF4870 family protein n=1 Tax=Gallibacterium genomosp. 1 TaxID=155515 RepID=UPI000A92F864|nr:hypothetical protein [Gallibacterium genomosp. 1]
MMEPTIYKMNDTKKWAMIGYWLYIASFLITFLSIVAIVIAYVFRDDVRGTYLESHFNYQIRTFWIGLLYAIICTVLCLVMVGYILFIGWAIWLLVRSIKGLRLLNRDQAILMKKRGYFKYLTCLTLR